MKNRLKRSIPIILLIIIPLLLIGNTGQVSAAAWDNWGSSPPPDSEGNYYTQYIRFIVNNYGYNKYEVPIEINPTFQDLVCNASSLRIVYENLSDMVELPYENTSPYVYYPSGYLQTVNLTFVAPQILNYTGNYFRLYWTYNASVQSPNYATSDFKSVRANPITQFYYLSTLRDTIDLRFDSAGWNNDTTFLVKEPIAPYNHTFTSSQFSFEGRADFNETSSLLSNIDLGEGYRNKGPVSIKLVDGTSAGWGSGTYMVVGTYNGTLIYQYTGGSSFSYVTGKTYADSPNCTGLAVGNVMGDATYEILTGLSNGSVFLYTFNGSDFSLQQVVFDNDTINHDTKAFGIGLIHANINDTTHRDVLVASADDDTGSNRGHLACYNESFSNPGSLEEKPTNTIFFSDYPYNYGGNIYGPNIYVDNFVNDLYNPGQEFLVAARSPTNSLIIVMGNATIEESYGNNTEGDVIYRKNLLSGPVDSLTGWTYFTVGSLGVSEMTALAYSKKLNDEPNNYTIVASTNNGWVYWYNLSYYSDSQSQLIGGSPYGYSYYVGDNVALLPITGNFDNINTSYDDVALASSLGDVYLMRYDPDQKNLVFVSKKHIANTDFTGIGQSVAKANLVGDARDELFVAGKDGIIRCLDTSLPSDIKIDVTQDDWANPEVSQTGENQYQTGICQNFHDDIENYISSGSYDTVTLADGFKYIIIPINISSSSAGLIHLSGLFIEYNTTDYTAVNKNDGVNLPDTTLSDRTIINLDNDHDEYPDIYEHLGIMYGNGSSSVPVYLTDDGVPQYIADGASLPPSYHLDPWNNDTDGDGIADGIEILTYYTNPMKNDTDADGITDYNELFGPYSSLLGPQCVVDPDLDHDTLNDLTEILNNGNPKLVDTDGDGINDTMEYYKYYSNLNNSDSDGDGIPDFDEAGLNASHRLSNIISGYIRYYSWPQLLLNNSDSDGDGLTDLQEITGNNSTVWNDTTKYYMYYTDPTNPDTDNDGINDKLEVLGTNYTFVNWTQDSSGAYHFKEVTIFTKTDPQSVDTDHDNLTDLQEIASKCNPIERDTDRDGLLDGDEVLRLLSFDNMKNLVLNATNPDTDGDGLIDGDEFYGIGFIVGKHSNPTLTDTDGDGWDDYKEVRIEYTDPDNQDSDGDGIIDSIDPMPMLNLIFTIFTYTLILFGFVASAITYPLNKKAAKVAARAKIEYKKKITKITKRLELERKYADRVTAFARMMPSNIESGSINVKINLRINDDSFFVRQAKLWYSAGADEFRSVMMDKIDDSNFSIIITNIPIDITVLYYFELMDKSGVWLKQLKDEAEQKTYEFSTSKDGIKEATDWDETGLIKCEVCGYMCRPEWETCPECNTPLHDTTQEIFLEDQKRKEEELKKQMDPDEIAWREAQQTDEFWRGLPECPNCGFAVQPDWASCPVCGFDLTTVELKPKAVYEDLETDMDYITEGEKKHDTYIDDTKIPKKKEGKEDTMEEIRKKKKKASEDEWGEGGEDRDIL